MQYSCQVYLMVVYGGRFVCDSMGRVGGRELLCVIATAYVIYATIQKQYRNTLQINNQLV